MDNVSFKRHSVFLGASGSGKTELSLNLAIRLSGLTHKKVSFFDMDQTKGLFRSRDLFEVMYGYGIDTVETYNFQDAPIIPAGVVSKIEDENTVCVFDVGGNTAGAVMIGQFTGRMKPDSTDYFYVINPCRPFTDNVEDIERNMVDILMTSGVDPSWIKVISNPNMGRETTAELIVEKHRRLEKMLAQLGIRLEMLCVEEGLAKEVEKDLDVPTIPVQLFIRRLY